MKNKVRKKLERMVSGVTLYCPTAEELYKDHFEAVCYRLREAMRGDTYYQRHSAVILPIPGETINEYDRRMYTARWEEEFPDGCELAD